MSYSHWQRQGLDGSFQGLNAAQVLERAGWARSVGSASPYLALFARAGLRRAEVDAAVAALEIHELPSARGCTYVLPSCDFALGLAIGADETELRQAKKLGVTDAEVALLSGAVRTALLNGPLSPDELRAATGSASRSLGEEGKKKGLTTTLPIALGLLQTAGIIRRVPVDGRLDRQRYKYALWNLPVTVDQPYAVLAKRFFAWTGDSSAESFRRFSGLGVKAARDAVAGLGISTPIADIRKARTPEYALLSVLDSFFLNQPLTAHDVHVIVDRGEVIGNWLFDTESQTIVWSSSVKPTPQLNDAIARTEHFIKEDLGDARSFSLDSPQSRAPRLAALRNAASR